MIKYKSTIFVLLLLALFSFSLFAEHIALQSFEESASDTWVYSADPADFAPYFWGRTNQPQGGAIAQDGDWYWASWLMEYTQASLTFSNVALTPGSPYSISFYYYSKNLVWDTDQLKVCLEYDNGTEWNNWTSLRLNTQAWTQFFINIPQTASTIRVKILTQYANADQDKYVHWDNFSIRPIATGFAAPEIFNTSVQQRRDGSKLVDIYYDLFDANDDICEIELTLSEDGGDTFDITPSPALISGDVGENIAPGSNKHIIWDAGAESRDFDGDQFMARFTADDGVSYIPTNFVLVEGGTFNNSFSEVTISSFYIDKYELTQTEYYAVMGSNPASGTGFGEGNDYPAYYISWFDAVEYCNRRSILEGLNPCYSYGNFGSNPDIWPRGWKSTSSNHSNVSCSWTANGYRMPTEMEWMFAARGGNLSNNYSYSGSNTLEDVAWYLDNSGSGTHPVGMKLPNELGIYDMTGNIWEWVWDIYDVYPYEPQIDPTGPASGTHRLFRGGGWRTQPPWCTVFTRYYYSATDNDNDLGIRLCLPMP